MQCSCLPNLQYVCEQSLPITLLGLENTEIQATDQPGRALLLGFALLDEKRVLHDSWLMDLLSTANYGFMSHIFVLIFSVADSRIWIATQLIGPSH